jgi:hypothetical protein
MLKYLSIRDKRKRGVFWPIRPGSKKLLETFGLLEEVEASKNINY